MWRRSSPTPWSGLSPAGSDCGGAGGSDGATVADAAATQLPTEAVLSGRAIDCKAVGIDGALAAARPQDVDIDFDNSAGSHPQKATHRRAHADGQHSSHA